MRSVERGVRLKKRRLRREASPSRGARLRPQPSRTTSRAGAIPTLMPLPQATTAGGRPTTEVAGAVTPTTSLVLLLLTSPRKVHQLPSIHVPNRNTYCERGVLLGRGRPFAAVQGRDLGRMATGSFASVVWNQH